MAAKVIFVTVGTTKFVSLISKLTQKDTLQLIKDLGYTKMILQIGHGDIPDLGDQIGFEIEYYRFKDSITEDIQGADLVISHAGAGSCLEVLDQRKPLLVVINETLMDNHQTELAEQLALDNHLLCCTCNTLKDTLLNLRLGSLKPIIKSNSNAFVNYLNQIMGFDKKD